MTYPDRRPLRILMLVVLAAGLWVAPSAQALEVHILERAEVTGSKVTLGEVARFNDERDPRVPEIRAMLLSHAPAPGKQLVLDRAFLSYRLKSRLAQQGLDLVLPKQLVVERLSQRVFREELEKLFTQHVLANMPWSSEEVKIRGIRSPEVVCLPRGRLSHSIQDLGRSSHVGNVSVLVTFFVDETQQRSVRLSGRVDVMQEVVVAGKDLKRNQTIDPEALTLKRMNLARLPAGVFNEVADVAGMHPMQAIRTGQVIFPRMVKRAPAVKRGDQLLLVAESGNLRVVTTGRALEDGHPGEQVRVVNATSGKEVRARVVGQRSVTVDF